MAVDAASYHESGLVQSYVEEESGDAVIHHLPRMVSRTHSGTTDLEESQASVADPL